MKQILSKNEKGKINSILFFPTLFFPNSIDSRGPYSENLECFCNFVQTTSVNFLELPVYKDIHKDGFSIGFLPKLRWDYNNKYCILYLGEIGDEEVLLESYYFQSTLQCYVSYAFFSPISNKNNANQKIKVKNLPDIYGLTLSLNSSVKIWNHYDFEINIGFELFKSFLDNAKWYDKTAPEGQQYSNIDFSKLKVYHKSSPFVSIGIAF